MSTAHLAAFTEQCRTALEGELDLLDQLQRSAERQRAATQADDIDALQEATDQREALTSALLTLDDRLRPMLERLLHEPIAVRQRPEFSRAVGLRQAVAQRVKDILDTDRGSIDSLELIVAARRAATQAAEQAEATLAAYGRMTAPRPMARLLNRRG